MRLIIMLINDDKMKDWLTLVNLIRGSTSYMRRFIKITQMSLDVFRDESGTAILEYSLFLSLASVAAAIIAVAFCSSLSNQFQNNVAVMKSYAVAPQLY